MKLIIKSFDGDIEVATSNILCSNLSFNTSNDVFVIAADCKKLGYLSISHLLNKVSNIFWVEFNAISSFFVSAVDSLSIAITNDEVLSKSNQTHNDNDNDDEDDNDDNDEYLMMLLC